jgi:hypothetical protein
MEPTQADDEPTDEVAGPRTPPAPRRRRGLIAAGVAVALVGAVSIKHLHQTEAAAPYQPAAVHARVTLAAGSVPNSITGQLTFMTPDNAPSTGQYTLIVVDSQTHEPTVLAGPELADGRFVRYNWDKRYAAALASVSAHGSGGALSFAPDTLAPITFTTTLATRPVGGTATPVAAQVSVVLAFYSSDGNLYWSARVPT